MAVHRVQVGFGKARVDVTFQGLVRDIVATRPCHDGTKEAAERIARIARSTGPGTYAESVTVTDHPANNDRAQHVVSSHHPASAIIEWGTATRPGKHILGRAVEAAGFERKGADR